MTRHDKDRKINKKNSKSNDPKSSDQDKKAKKASKRTNKKANKEPLNIPNPKEAIAKRASQMLAKPSKHLTINDLLSNLLRRFPAEDAESWDRTGMLVGEGALPVNKVAVTLDPTVEAIKEASAIGANVLVTHHPLFLNAPDNFQAAKSVAISNGAGVWAAIQNHVSVMSFHTALDVSKQAQLILPNMLGFAYETTLVPIPTSKQKGYGQLSKVPTLDSKPQSLSQVSAKCVSVFGRAPRVWGNPEKEIKTALTFGGSASSFANEILNSNADVVICGEIKYHTALDLKEAGMAIIELGHDLSELPLLAILAKSVADAGISESNIKIIDQSNNWYYPESIRL